MKLFTMLADLQVLTAQKLLFEPGNFVDMLGYMARGMLVIFVIIGVIILATVLINKLFSDKK